MALLEKAMPLIAKARGKAPFCPLASALQNLRPYNFKLRPPRMHISVVTQEVECSLLSFDGKHAFWFPRQTRINQELWNEYLAVFWNHPANAHYYLRRGVGITVNQIVYDCGACEGFFARLALDLGAKSVVCIEPSSIMRSCLRKTFAQEITDGRIVIVEAALSSVIGTACFSQKPGEAFTGRLDEFGAASVELTTLDTVAACVGAPDFIKMDLEGAEYEALRGGFALLDERHPNLAVTTYHYAWDYCAIASLVRSAGYNRLWTSAATMRHSSVPRPVMLYACCD